MAKFTAVLIEKAEAGQKVGFTEFDESDLMDGDVTIRVEWSCINYKDGLAVSGLAPVVRRWPMIPGIDLAGTVESSSHAQWKKGDSVVLNGFGLGETHLGAWAEKARVKGDWLTPLPQGMTTRDAMAIGTAGYTAMLAVIALERHGVSPDKGAIVVTGAVGGLGSVAIALLSQLGYHVVASTGRANEADYLKSLGAKEVIERAELTGPVKPLTKERFAGGIELGRLNHAGKRALHDSLRRCGRSVRSRRRTGTAHHGRSVHPPRRLAVGGRFRLLPSAAAARSLAPACRRSRPRQARRHHQRGSIVRRDRNRTDDRGRQVAWPPRREGRVINRVNELLTNWCACCAP